jgi:hypothetical protein
MQPSGGIARFERGKNPVHHFLSASGSSKENDRLFYRRVEINPLDVI